MISTREELSEASAAFIADYLGQTGSAAAEEGRGTGCAAPRLTANTAFYSPTGSFTFREAPPVACSPKPTLVQPAALLSQVPLEARPGSAPPLPTVENVEAFEAVLAQASRREQQQLHEAVAYASGGGKGSGAGWLRQFRSVALRR